MRHAAYSTGVFRTMHRSPASKGEMPLPHPRIARWA